MQFNTGSEELIIGNSKPRIMNVELRIDHCQLIIAHSFFALEGSIEN